MSFRKRRNPVGHSFMNVWTNKLLRVGGKIPKHSAVASYKLKSETIIFSITAVMVVPEIIGLYNVKSILTDNSI